MPPTPPSPPPSVQRLWQQHHAVCVSLSCPVILTFSLPPLTCLLTAFGIAFFTLLPIPCPSWENTYPGKYDFPPKLDFSSFPNNLTCSTLLQNCIRRRMADFRQSKGRRLGSQHRQKSMLPQTKVWQVSPPMNLLRAHTHTHTFFFAES